MKFKEGDKIVCIEPIFEKEPTLELYNVYVVKECLGFEYRDVKIEALYLCGVDGVGCSENRFISMNEFRKLKIDDILK
jgi:hypothetical protein